VLERARLLLRENDHLPGPFCESLEHVCFLPAGRCVVSLAARSRPLRQSTNRLPRPARLKSSPRSDSLTTDSHGGRKEGAGPLEDPPHGAQDAPLALLTW